MATLEECGHDSKWLVFSGWWRGKKLYECGFCKYWRR